MRTERNMKNFLKKLHKKEWEGKYQFWRDDVILALHNAMKSVIFFNLTAVKHFKLTETRLNRIKPIANIEGQHRPVVKCAKHKLSDVIIGLHPGINWNDPPF